MDPVPWREAWHEALYAAGQGFYVSAGGPAAHFTTATHGPSGRVLAEALIRLWLQDHDHLPAVVVDVGAGRGELATHLRAALDTHPPAPARPSTPTHLSTPTDPSPSTHPSAPTDPSPSTHPSAPNAALGGKGQGVPGQGGPGESASGEAALGRRGVRVIAVDVVARPEGLDERIEWLRSPGGSSLPEDLVDLGDALVIAHEWLDVVPCEVAEADEQGQLRTVLVHPSDGVESLGDVVSPADAEWASAHWPTHETGDRVEIGRARDRAWQTLVDRVGSGLVIAVDYGHTRATRPHGGTLTAYAAGHQTHPVPDGSCDITAHVAMDTLEHDELRTQREILRDLGVLGRTPPISLASSEPIGYIRALERAGAEAQLIDPQGFGAFWWVVRRIAAT